MNVPSMPRAARIGACFSVAAALTTLQPAPASAEVPPPLALRQTIALPDVRGRIDHLAIDLDGERLFVAALGNDTVEVIDLRAGQRSSRLAGLQEPQGLGYVPEGKRLFVANGRGARVDVFAGSPLARTARIEGLDDADNVRYEGNGAKLYVGYGHGLAVIEPATAKLVDRIPLAGHPEAFQLEADGPRIFVNVPSAGRIAVVDRSRRAVIASWALGEAKAKANFPMALDEAEHRLFVATRHPAALLVYDTESGKRVADVSIAGDADDLFFDREGKRIFVVCGEGAVDIVQQRDANRYAVAGEVRTAVGARTGLFVPSRHALYVAVPARGATGAEVRVYAVD